MERRRKLFHMVRNGIVEVIVTGGRGDWSCLCSERDWTNQWWEKASVLMQHHGPNATSRVTGAQITKAGLVSLGHKALFARRLMQPYHRSDWLKKGDAEQRDNTI